MAGSLRYIYSFIYSGYLGMKTGDSQWFDGTAVDYTRYGK